uniref:Uncharacterized protein n=1 Tax=Ciona intestinalis TaxID=7719 RepID=F6TWW4_CIOIN
MNKQLILLLALCLIQSSSADDLIWPAPSGRRRRRWNQKLVSSLFEEEDALMSDLLTESS